MSETLSTTLKQRVEQFWKWFPSVSQKYFDALEQNQFDSLVKSLVSKCQRFCMTWLGSLVQDRMTIRIR